MLRSPQRQECFICSERFNIIISVQQSLKECDELSIIEVLENLHLFSISDAENHCRTICFICAVKIQSYYNFKRKCEQIFKVLESNDGLFCDSSEVPLLSSFPKIKTEISRESDEDEICDENVTFGNFIKEEIVVNAENSLTQKSHTEKVFTSPIPLQSPKQKRYSSINKYLPTSNDLGKHRSTIRDGEKPYVCDVCSKAFNRPSLLRGHKLIHSGEKPFVCDVCNKSFNQSGTLNKHTLIHTGQKPYTCDVCNKTFRHSCGLAHHKLLHTGQKPYVCDICSKAFTQMGKLSKHKLIHTGQRPYVCHVCNKSFTQSGSLRKHKLIHSGERPYVCDVCNKSFNDVSNLKRHKLGHNKN